MLYSGQTLHQLILQQLEYMPNDSAQIIMNLKSLPCHVLHDRAHTAGISMALKCVHVSVFVKH